jgi:hypothetical protein
MSMGMATWSSMPAASTLSRSVLVAFAVMAMIGTSRQRRSARMCCVATYPSMPGIWQFMRMQ